MPIVTSRIISEDVLSTMTDRQIFEELLMEITKIQQVTTEDVILLPKGYNYNTSKNASSPETILPDPTLTSHFILQNKGASGTNNLLVGDSTVQAISIAPGAMLLYSFNLVNYKTDLNKWYVSSATASQPYSVLIFYQQ